MEKILYRFDYEPEDILYGERGDESTTLRMMEYRQLETFELLYRWENEKNRESEYSMRYDRVSDIKDGMMMAIRSLGLGGEYEKYRSLREQGYSKPSGREMVKEA